MKCFESIRLFSSITIFSKSSGFGKCGVAVIRVSGENTNKALKALTNFDNFKPRFATLKQIKDPETNILIDNGLILYFKSPKSFTGEDCCEFQVHGGPAVITAILNALSKVDGLRPALPGEFTKRAFYNGKMDLTEVEGLADLIHAETEYQRRQALIQADGHLSNLYKKWRTQLIRNIAHIEAFIDFSEDENIEDDVLEVMEKDLHCLEKEIKQYLVDGRKGERLRDGVKMAIVGETNVGKSSLMNVIVQRDISIVTNIEGTTRDIVESHYDIGGYPVVIADTAGLRESKDIVESEGILRAKKYASNADFILILIDGEKMEKLLKDFEKENVEKYIKEYKNRLGLDDGFRECKQMLTIINKIDLVSCRNKEILKSCNFLGISCTKAINIQEALEEIKENLQNLCGNPTSESPLLSQARHRHYLQNCLKSIQDFLSNFDQSNEQDFAILVQSLRNAVRCIGHLTGEVRTDDILDVIFKDFCIGK
ncbi:CLUMA_CG017965, isoform A [Clunio marinus]|uniref:CLUMA_CG017965, isoform A n=1 Tax=Clunio marinus TaxID=568069 RepID=A0A1J1J3I9_9DIPT|nr:CLUMA_CG017965, isoform A [Clunio marinus]